MRRNRTGGLAFRSVGIVLMAAVLVVTLGHDVPRPHFVEQQDKLEHVLAFLALGLAFGWNVTARGMRVAAVVLIAAAVGIELLQGMLGSGRDPDLWDALSSGVGGLTGLVVAAFLNAGTGFSRSARAAA